jgi:hypothetical protein
MKIRGDRWAALLLAAIAAACASPGTSPDPTSGNRRPVILHLAAFPEVTFATDSVLVVCQAMDPDCDTLVYDWITDARMRIKGARDGEYSLYNTFESFQVFYPAVHGPADTAWVQCFARDRRGKSAQQVIVFVIRS